MRLFGREIGSERLRDSAQGSQLIDARAGIKM